MTSETDVQNSIRIRAAQAGMILWRNNSGVLPQTTGYHDEDGTFIPAGRPIRFGLGNDSKAANAACKSSDLIGIAADGRFLAVECKAPGWRFTNTAREKAQLAYITLVRRRGGVALFATSWECVENELAGKIDARLETQRTTGRGARGGRGSGVGAPHMQGRGRKRRLQPPTGQALLPQPG